MDLDQMFRRIWGQTCYQRSERSEHEHCSEPTQHEGVPAGLVLLQHPLQGSVVTQVYIWLGLQPVPNEAYPNRLGLTLAGLVANMHGLLMVIYK